MCRWDMRAGIAYGYLIADMPVYLDKKTKRYFIQFQKDGHRYKERLPKGIKLADANAIELQMRHRIAFQKHGIETDTDVPTFERFVMQVYLPAVDGSPSYVKAIYVCKAALQFLKGKRLDEILPMHIDEFKRHREKLPTMHGTPRKPATIHRELCILSKIFTLAIKNQIITYNPVRSVDKPRFNNLQTRVLTESEAIAFIDALPTEYARDVCLMALCTGLRQNDILSLTRFQVDASCDHLSIVQSKTMRTLEVELSGVAKEIIQKRVNRYPDGLLFRSPRNESKGGSVRHTMLRTCRRIGIEPVTLRDLRRTAATWAGDAGFSASTIAAMLGHTSLRVAHRYIRGNEDKRKLAEFLGNRATIVPAAQLRKVK